MASSRSGAGGKILVNRRKKRVATTPYGRPSPTKSSSWFSGRVFPSARAIASGAGKIISAVLYSESESSSDDEGEECTAEDEFRDDNKFQIPCDEVNALNETIQPKQFLKQLITHETFSREECDRLTKVLQSRVVYGLIDVERRMASSPCKMIDNEDNDIYSEAIWEAKEWFQEKNLGSNSLAKPEERSRVLSPSGVKYVNGLVDSPVDVAITYMKDRPPWTSPTKLINSGTTLMTSIQLLKEETPFALQRDSLSISKTRNCLASGSWNIQEELRKVRSKATEDMLRSPSSKIDRSLLATATSRKGSGGTGDLLSGFVGEAIEPHSLRNNWEISKLMDAEVKTDPSLAAALESRHDGKASGALSSMSATLSSGNNEFSKAVPVDGDCFVSKFQYHTSSKIEGHHSGDVERWWDEEFHDENDTQEEVKLKQERELKRLESSVNYDGRND